MAGNKKCRLERHLYSTKESNMVTESNPVSLATPQEVAQTYNSMIADYDNVDDEAFYYNQYRAYTRHLQENRVRICGHVLDLGCGTGLQVPLVQESADRITGIDISEGLLQVARRKFSNVNFLLADACDLPFQDSYFDTVISYGEVFSHISEYKTAFKEAIRVLKPGGYFLFSILNIWNIRTFLYFRELREAIRTNG